MTRGEAQRRGLPIMGTLRSFATVGVPPAIMGIAPSKAIPAALDKAGLTKDDIDVYEVNEAFASQVGSRLAGMVVNSCSDSQGTAEQLPWRASRAGPSSCMGPITEGPVACLSSCLPNSLPTACVSWAWMRAR